jgi:hypothetical protein
VPARTANNAQRTRHAVESASVILARVPDAVRVDCNDPDKLLGFRSLCQRALGSTNAKEERSRYEHHHLPDHPSPPGVVS